MKSLTGSAILAATAMLWSVSAAVPASAKTPKTAVEASSKASAALKLTEFSSQRRHHRRFGHVRHHRRAYALYRPYHYRAYRPHYRAYYRPYYRPYRTFGFYRPWHRPYYGALSWSRLSEQHFRIDKWSV
ncbi:hypothetical protein, partial [Bradyrhizobium retamae]|uniref:hypothetical protein n=1 Tax=Bradyrhizobium retamae TaxID=1300035 RepID=UPI0009E715F5